MAGTVEAGASAPLSDILVVEHSHDVAAAYAGRMLAIMGATVVSVEAPGCGHPLRRVGPPLGSGCPGSCLFEYLGVNKMGVTLDVRRPSGQRLLDELLAKADILLDDTPVRTRPSIGLEPDEVLVRHPNLIYTSVLPFGAFGPRAEWVADEINILHAGGEGYLMPNGLALEMFSDRPPVRPYGFFAQYQGGTSAALACLSALFARPASGGQFVDVSVEDANVALSCMTVQRYGEGVIENRRDRSFRYGGVLECKDGYVEVLTLEQHQWENLVHVMGDPEWAKAPDLKDAVQRGVRGAEINAHIRAWAKQQTVAELVRRARQIDVPLAQYNTEADVLASEHEQARGLFQAVQSRRHGPLPLLVAPFQFLETPLSIDRPAPDIGEDNRLVYGEWLGHPNAQLDALWGGGIL